MTAAQTTAAPGDEEMVSDVTITLSNDVLSRLSQVVSFRTVGDVQNLVADAINSYVQLGQLHAGGAEIFAVQGDDSAPVRLRFPFDPAAQPPSSDAEE